MAFTSVIQGARGAGNGLAANQKPDVWGALGILEPYNYPATQYLFFGSKKQKEVKNKSGKFSWMEDELFPHNTTVAVAITASGGNLALTNVNVANVNIFNVNDLVIVEANDEMARVSAIGTNSATLTAADGSSSLASISGTGSYIKILASMFAEGSTAPTAFSTKEVEVHNHLTIMKKAITTTGRDQAGEAFTDGLSHAEQVQKVMKEMKFQLERITMLSLESGNAASAGSLVQTYGKGLLGMLTSNIQTTAYGSLTETLLDTFAKLVGAKGSQNKIVYAGSNRFHEIQTILKAKYNSLPANIVATKYGVKVIQYIFGTTTLDLIYNPVLDGKYTNWAIAIDKDKFTGRYMANDLKGSRKFRIEKGIETPGTDGRTDLILADLGAQYMNEETGGVLKA
jgi:hypothetical protein